MSPFASTAGRHAARVAVKLGWLPFALVGCISFQHDKAATPRTPAMVQRFADEASALGIPPSSPRLADLTRTLARAVESLPRGPTLHDFGQQIEAQANTLETQESVEPVRRSLDTALRAVAGLKRPAGSEKDRQRAMDEARRAVDALGATSATNGSRAPIESAYRAVAHAMLIVTGGQAAGASGRELPALVAHMAVEESEQARRSGAQVVYAIAGALETLPSHPLKAQHLAGKLRTLADRLADASELDYSPLLKEALAIAVEALDAVEKVHVALATLRTQARTAVERIAIDRPFALQRAVAQDAVRLIADALAVAAAR
jgi:hypothetical protein